MAIAHNISSTQYVATGTTNTITIAPTATATGLIAYVMLPNAKSVTSVTWKGTPLTLLTSQVCGPFTLYAYTLASPSTGSGNLVLTVGSSSESYFSASFYNDTDTTTVVDTFAKQSNASGTTLTQTVTTSADNEWTSCVALADMGGLSASTGSTVRGSILNTAFGVFDSNGPITPAGSTSMLQTVNNGNNGGIIIALKPSNLIIPDTATATFAVVDPTVTTAQNVTRARYWVGGTGTWSSTNTANWSATSGGAGGQSVPVAGDSIYFDHNSGGGTVTFNYSPQYKDFSAWGFTGTITSTGTVMPVCSGNFEPGYTATFGSNGSQSMLFTGGSSTRDVRLSSFAQYASGGLNFDPNVIFRNLDITFGTASSGNYSASLNGAMSIYGLFRIDGSMHTTTGLRVRAVSSGTTQTITMQPGSSFELNKCTFRDINVVGATLSGTQVAVINNTTNVTPSSPTTYYWIGGTGNYNDASKWSLSSGGPSASAYPHTGDRMVFDANSFTSDNQTFTYNTAFGPEVDLRNVTRPVNLTFNTVGGQSPTICGSLRLRSNVTVNGNSTFFFTAPNDIYIDWNGATYTGTATAVMTLQSVGIGNHLASNLVLPSTSTVSISSVSAFDTLGYNIITGFLAGSSSQLRTYDFTGSKVYLTGNNGTIGNFGTTTNLTFIKSIYPFYCNYSGSTGTRTFSFGSSLNTYAGVPDVSVTAGTDTFATSTSRYGHFDMTGFTGSLALNSRVINGNFILDPRMSLASGASTTTFTGQGGSYIIDTKGLNLNFPVIINGVGSTWTLASNLLMGSTRALAVTNGTFDALTSNVTCGSFSLNAGTKTVRMGTGTWDVQNTGVTVFDINTNNAGLTFDGSNATLKVSDTGAGTKTVRLGTNTFKTLWIAGGSGIVQLGASSTDNPTVGTLRIDGPATVNTFAGNTIYHRLLDARGVSGGVVTMQSTTGGSKWYLVSTSGESNFENHVAIKDNTATGATYTAQGSIGAWDLGNNSGWNSTEYTNPLTFTIPLSYLTDQDFVSALRFNGGSTNYVSITNPTALDFTNSFTISCIIKTDVVADTGGLELYAITKGLPAGGTYKYAMYVGIGNQLAFSIYDGTSNPTLRDSAGVQVGQWARYTGTYDGANLKLYRNLTYVGALATTVVMPTGTTNVEIGRRAGASDRGFKGVVSEPMFWNRPLTNEENIELNTYGIRPGSTLLNGLRGSYLFNEQSGTIQYDSSGYGNHGTSTGAFYTNDVPSPVIVTGDAVHADTTSTATWSIVPIISAGQRVSVTPTTLSVSSAIVSPSIKNGGTFTVTTANVQIFSHGVDGNGDATISPSTLVVTSALVSPTVTGYTPVSATTQATTWALVSPTIKLGATLSPLTLQTVFRVIDREVDGVLWSTSNTGDSASWNDSYTV